MTTKIHYSTKAAGGLLVLVSVATIVGVATGATNWRSAGAVITPGKLQPLSGQLVGRVTTTSGKPAIGAMLVFRGQTTLSTTTDVLGNYGADLPIGRYSLSLTIGGRTTKRTLQVVGGVSSLNLAEQP